MLQATSGVSLKAGHLANVIDGFEDETKHAAENVNETPGLHTCTCRSDKVLRLSNMQSLL